MVDQGVSGVSGASLRDRAVAPSASSPAAQVSPVPASIPSAIYEARPIIGREWIWEVWDVEHPCEGNHFPVLRVDSKGACDDFHREIALVCAAALNARFAASAIEARRAETAQTGSVADESAVPKADAQNGGAA